MARRPLAAEGKVAPGLKLLGLNSMGAAGGGAVSKFSFYKKQQGMTNNRAERNITEYGF